ncbi:MAG: 30S ribosomal protein S19e [Nanoarchaeota archaeon]|nr:30S ribosomal protein S19e [Nanoarchaeota archaeon]
MITVYEVQADKFNEKLADALKEIKEFEIPDWANFVKSGVSRSRPPKDYGFWHRRAASILKQIYIRGVVGVNRLKTRYGGKKERGARPSEFRKGGGKIIRTILQQAEKAGLLEKSTGKKSGRQLTKTGIEFMNKIAGSLKEEKNEVV